MGGPVTVGLRAIAVAVVAAAVHASDSPAGEPGGPGLALHAKKVLVAEYGGVAAVDNGTVLVRDGKIEAVGTRREIEVPDGYDVVDLGPLWLAPGMIDLHSHVANGLEDLSDSVYLTNPGHRSSSAIVPGYSPLQVAVAGGVTTVLYIPGSATNMGGQGILLRTAPTTFEEMKIRDPGSLKLAQAGNPEFLPPWNPGRTFMNYNTRSTFRRGLAYAKRYKASDSGSGPKIERNLQFDVFRELAEGRTQVSTHTQIYQVVLETLTMIKGEFGLDVYIDHGTFDGYRAAAKAQEMGVPAILGPRQIQTSTTGWVDIDQDGRIEGVAAKYQEAGHEMVGFNTDAIGSWGIGQEELGLQAAMAVRYGFDDSEMDAVRGVTVVPAMAAGIDDRFGSIEAGKDADLIAVTGNPTDPRSSVEFVLSAGKRVYDVKVHKRRF